MFYSFQFCICRVCHDPPAVIWQLDEGVGCVFVFGVCLCLSCSRGCWWAWSLQLLSTHLLLISSLLHSGSSSLISSPIKTSLTFQSPPDRHISSYETRQLTWNPLFSSTPKTNSFVSCFSSAHRVTLSRNPDLPASTASTESPGTPTPLAHSDSSETPENVSL